LLPTRLSYAKIAKAQSAKADFLASPEAKHVSGMSYLCAGDLPILAASQILCCAFFDQFRDQLLYM
jgi:hypothetical protein